LLSFKGKNPLALNLSGRFLARRLGFTELEELDWAFGTMGTQDKKQSIWRL
jgi:hypothetical protein